MCDFPLVYPSNRHASSVLRWLATGLGLVRSDRCWVFDYVAPRTWSHLGLPFSYLGTVSDSDVEWVLESGFAVQAERGARIVVAPMGGRFLRALDRTVRQGRSVVTTVDRAKLRSVLHELLRDYPDCDDFQLAQTAAQAIMRVVLGEDWLKAHVLSDSPPTNFFRNNSVTDAEGTLGAFRIVQLGEMILNLQYVPGVLKTLEMIRKGDIEGGFAELEVAKLLFVNDRSFEFVEPRRKKKDDYDLLVRFGDLSVPAETKCKYELTNPTENTLVDTLRTARDQLPDDRPSVVLVKLPPVWSDGRSEDALHNLLEAATKRFFRGTGAVVSVKYHTSLIFDTGQTWSPIVLLTEFSNDRHRFDPHVSWNIFRAIENTPDTWIRLHEESYQVVSARGRDGS